MRIEATVSPRGDVIEVRATGSMLSLPRELLVSIVARLVGNALAELEGVPVPTPELPELPDLDDDPAPEPPAIEHAEPLADEAVKAPAAPQEPPVAPERPGVNLGDPDAVREEALRLLDEGALTVEEIARQLAVTPRLVQRWDEEAATGEHPRKARIDA